MTTRVALPVIGGLAVAYLERIAAGDTTRAAIVLRTVASVWPDLRTAFAAEVAAQLTDPSQVASVSYPSSLLPEWGGNTRIILATAVAWASTPGTPLRTAADALYDATPASLPAAARDVMQRLPASAPIRRYVSYATSAPVSSMAQGLEAMVAGTIATGADDAAPPPRTEPTPPRKPPVALPETRIVGQSASPTSSPWGWYALAGALAIGLGVFAWSRLGGAAA